MIADKQDDGPKKNLTWKDPIKVVEPANNPIVAIYPIGDPVLQQLPMVMIAHQIFDSFN